MTTNIIGKLKVIGDLQTFDSGFVKQQIVVTSDEQYPSDIPIDFLKDKTDYLQIFKVGDNVTVSVNIKGSEYNGKYYVGLNGWSIKKTKVENQNETPPSNMGNPKPYNSFVDEPKVATNDEEDDLPF